jgi:hypothetical protein
MNEMKFYGTKWFTFLMLFVFAPVGIYLLWKNKHFNNNASLLLSILFCIWFIGLVNNFDNIESNSDKYNFTSPDEVTEPQIVTERNTPEPSTSAEPLPT